MLPKDEDISKAAAELKALVDALGAVLFGQTRIIEQVVIGVVAGGHILLEGLPGLGKTQLVKGLSRALGVDHKRIQFTPDLLPGDITGNPIFEDQEGRRRFVFQPGPIFSNLVLADEINRASPKTQSALLEAMAESQVTVLGEAHALPKPFFVLATQNPIELEGTYPLPEAQLDRFLMKLVISSNDVEVLERIVLERDLHREVEVRRVMDRERLLQLRALSKEVHMPKVVARYIARLVDATHAGRSKTAEHFEFGASPRAALALSATAKARAMMLGRSNVDYKDVAALAASVLAHRVVLAYRARVDGLTSPKLIDALLAEIGEDERPLPATITRSAAG